jgi:ferredoxin
VETTSETKPAEMSLKWLQQDSASKEEMAIFWKKLRHFYRTGEKSEKNESLTSGIAPLLENSSNYPFYPEGEKGPHFEFNSQTSIRLLDHFLTSYQKENRANFKAKLAKLVVGLRNMLNVADKGAEAKELQAAYDFADELIAFDKMVELIPHSKNKGLDQVRTKRLTHVLGTLTSGLGYFGDLSATLIADKGQMTLMRKEKLFRDTLIVEAENDAFGQSQCLFQIEIAKFTELIKAYRIASLEVDDAYNPEIHDEYFEHFSWHKLFDEELKLFHPIVLLVTPSDVFNNLTSLSKLFTTNQPINLIVLNDEHVSIPQTQISWEDAAHQFRQELAALAISHRNVFTFQANLSDPDFVYQGIESALRSSAPSLCHLSVPLDESACQDIYANAGRYFPSVIYDPFKESTWGGRFDLTGNVQPAEAWPKLTLKTQTKDTEATIDVSFTYADYKATYRNKADELMVIPSAYYSEHLLPLGDYLELDEQLLYGKIPYIWLKNDQQELFRAAVPNVWVISCQERLDHWRFLQELGGGGRQITQEANIQDLLDTQKLELETAHQVQVAKIQEDAIANAAERLIAVLLDDDELKLDALSSENQVQVTAETSGKTKTEVVKSDEQPEVTASTEQAWVESENCTTCNECTDKYPAVFKYNDEKQAYITDASKGTFADLVKAAENCPAACIHPGTPLNPKEPKLEALIKRAAKFN